MVNANLNTGGDGDENGAGQRRPAEIGCAVFCGSAPAEQGLFQWAVLGKMRGKEGIGAGIAVWLIWASEGGEMVEAAVKGAAAILQQR
ncbi:hypothetical protein M0R45_001874 [Rubus argutus]|uniref:Uncharacterized protein n=1 Tax=Rubus argutus TaxID=59490 RepID=A0AAW1VJB2_RUBAR